MLAQYALQESIVAAVDDVMRKEEATTSTPTANNAVRLGMRIAHNMIGVLKVRVGLAAHSNSNRQQNHQPEDFFCWEVGRWGLTI